MLKRILLVVVVGSTLIVGCENDPKAVAAMFPEIRPDAEKITNFETIYSDSAEVKVRISGPELLRYTEGAEVIQVFPKGVYVEFFDAFGEISSTLASKYGIRYENEERVIVRDSVVWQAQVGDRLDTEELVWEAQNERIYSDRYVRLKQDDKIITGVGFESNQNFTRSKVRAIQGVMTIQE